MLGLSTHYYSAPCNRTKPTDSPGPHRPESRWFPHSYILHQASQSYPRSNWFSPHPSALWLVGSGGRHCWRHLYLIWAVRYGSVPLPVSSGRDDGDTWPAMSRGIKPGLCVMWVWPGPVQLTITQFKLAWWPPAPAACLAIRVSLSVSVSGRVAFLCWVWIWVLSSLESGEMMRASVLREGQAHCQAILPPTDWEHCTEGFQSRF